MGSFNYSRFHYFDKNGHELIISYKPNVKIKIKNEEFPSFSSEYAYVRSNPDMNYNPHIYSSMLKLKSGMRFNFENSSQSIKADVYVNDTSSGEQYFGEDLTARNGSGYDIYKLVNYTANLGEENYPELSYNNTTNTSRKRFLENMNLYTRVNFFPTCTFSSNITFDRISTGLVETQTIYILVEDLEHPNDDGTINFVTLKEYASHTSEYDDEIDEYTRQLNEKANDIRTVDASIAVVNAALSSYRNSLAAIDASISAKQEELADVENDLFGNYYAYGRSNPELEAQRVQIKQELAALEAQRKTIVESPTAVELLNTLDEYTNLKKMYITERSEISDKLASARSKKSNFTEVENYINRFRLLFFIDCREQEDFRIFNVNYDEMSWSDRRFVDFRKDNVDGSNDNGYSVNIGFSGQNDGVYEHNMYVCLVDTSKATENSPGEAYPIGEIKMSAETEGEDERYRTFFTNFGIPDPKYYDDIFSETNINDDLPDYASINKHSKKMFLAYSDIFPYIGSYKALINAVKFLGYENDIFFKEWYKEIGKDTINDDGYITYEISYGNPSKKNTISNLSLSERIHLRKMNWISMVYRINEELDKAEDQFGFPTAITNVRNFNTDRLAKLHSLKKWLEKYAIGVNCHITDISGEGLVFERYSLNKFGSYQKVFEYNNEKAISAVAQNNVVTLKNGEATINVDIHTSNKNTTIEDLGDNRFIDLCEGYFDDQSAYHDHNNENVPDSSLYVYFGDCFDLNDNINTFEVRARGTHNSFKFCGDLIDSYSPALLLDDDRFIFDPYTCYHKFKNVNFTNPPVIQIENGIIKRYKSNTENNGEHEYYANIYPYIDSSTNPNDPRNGVKHYRIEVCVENGVKLSSSKKYELLDVPTLLPPQHALGDLYPEIYPIHGNLGLKDTFYYNKWTNIKRSIITPRTDADYSEDPYETNVGTFGLRYTIDNIHAIPCWMILGYEEKNMMLDQSDNHNIFPPLETSNNNDSVYGYEYMLEIINGRMIFNDPENNRIITLNFEYDEETNHQRIYVNTFKESAMSSMYKYIVDGGKSVNRFLPSNNYAYFLNGYKDPEKIDSYITYDGSKSIKVNHAGHYIVDAILYDEFNNIFAKRSTDEIIVLTPYADSSIYIVESSSPAPVAKNGKLGNLLTFYDMLKNDVDECVFEYVPKLQVTGIDSSNVISYAGRQNVFDGTSDDGVNTLTNYKKNRLAILTSLSDRFEIISKYEHEFDGGSYPMFRISKRSTYNSHKFWTKDDSMTTTGTIYEDTYALLQKNIAEGNTNGDVVLIIYDDVCEYPVVSYTGVMLPYSKYNNNAKYDEYCFAPQSTQDGESIETLMKNDHSRYSYYVIPQWLVKCSINFIDPENNNISLKLSDYPFKDPFNVNDMRTLVYNTRLYPTQYGYGSYKINSASKTGVILYAYLGENQNEHDPQQRNFDGSTLIGSASLDYMKYALTTDEKKNNNQVNEAQIIETSEYKYGKLFINYEYAVSIRDFDPDDAIELWDFSAIRYRSYSAIPGRYGYNVPITTYNPFIELAPFISGTYSSIYNIRNADVTIRWRIYKRTGQTNHKLVIESYNKVMMIKLVDYGVYDIEMTAWDQYGNKHERILNGYVTYKKN